MSGPAAGGPKGRLAIGLVLIGLGLFMTLGQAGLVDLRGLGRFWPLLLLGVGAVKVTQPLEDGQRALGVALLLMGGFFQVLSLLTWGSTWPLGLVAVGAFMVWQAVDRPPVPRNVLAPSPHLSELAFMAGSKRALRQSDLRGGYATAVMGGIELDLRQCRPDASPLVLDVVAVWGGLELKVPPEWRVEGKVVPVMGGFEDKTRPAIEAHDAPVLVLRGYAVMGAVIVGN